MTALTRTELASNIGQYFQVKCPSPTCGGNNTYSVDEVFAETGNVMAGGALVGGLIGILGGPVGVILGGIIGGALGKGADEEDGKKVEFFNSRRYGQ